jgi:hypothetical protein
MSAIAEGWHRERAGGTARFRNSKARNGTVRNNPIGNNKIGNGKVRNVKVEKCHRRYEVERCHWVDQFRLLIQKNVDSRRALTLENG